MVLTIAATSRGSCEPHALWSYPPTPMLLTLPALSNVFLRISGLEARLVQADLLGEGGCRSVSVGTGMSSSPSVWHHPPGAHFYMSRELYILKQSLTKKGQGCAGKVVRGSQRLKCSPPGASQRKSLRPPGFRGWRWEPPLSRPETHPGCRRDAPACAVLFPSLRASGFGPACLGQSGASCWGIPT